MKLRSELSSDFRVLTITRVGLVTLGMLGVALIRPGTLGRRVKVPRWRI